MSKELVQALPARCGVTGCTNEAVKWSLPLSVRIRKDLVRIPMCADHYADWFGEVA